VAAEGDSAVLLLSHKQAVRLGLKGRCPRCGTGRLFTGLLSVTTECPDCALPISNKETADGPAFFVITLLGFLLTGLAVWVEIVYAPPLWLHLALWLPVTLASSLYLLRVCKAMMIAYHYRLEQGLLHGHDTE